MKKGTVAPQRERQKPHQQRKKAKQQEEEGEPAPPEMLEENQHLPQESEEVTPKPVTIDKGNHLFAHETLLHYLVQFLRPTKSALGTD